MICIIVNFLHIMCEAISLIQNELETSNDLTPQSVVWAVTTGCHYCSAPIDEIPIVATYIPSGTYGKRVLNTCRLDNVTRDLILKSFNEQAFKNPMADDAPSHDLAMLGVC